MAIVGGSPPPTQFESFSNSSGHQHSPAGAIRYNELGQKVKIWRRLFSDSMHHTHTHTHSAEKWQRNRKYENLVLRQLSAHRNHVRPLGRIWILEPAAIFNLDVSSW